MGNSNFVNTILLNKYTVTRRFKSTNTFTLYKCEYKDNEYIAKVHQNVNFFKKKNTFYQNFNIPGIVDLVEFGLENNRFIEVFPFHGENNLFNTVKKSSLNRDQILSSLIPTINDSIHSLHQMGIVHGSVFPYNLFYANRKKKIVLSFPNIETAFERVKEFTVKEINEQNITPSSDYYAFGMTILFFIQGYDEFYKLVRQEELFINYLPPSCSLINVPNDFINLIRGLTDSNPEKRWGFQEVSNWLSELDQSESEFIKEMDTGQKNVSHNEKIEKVTEAVIDRTEKEEFPQIDNFYATDYLDKFQTLAELIDGILQEWNQIKYFISTIKEYALKFNTSLEENLTNIEKYENKDYALYKLIDLLKTDNFIYWKGNMYPNIEKLGYTLEETLPQIDFTFVELITSGCFTDIIEKTNPNEKKRKKALKIISLVQTDKLLALYKLSYILTSKRSFTFELGTAETISDFINLLYKNKENINEISSNLLYNKEFIAWIGHKGYDTFIDHWQDQINITN